MSFKLHSASYRGGELAQEQLTHPQKSRVQEGGERHTVNSIVRVAGSLGQTNVRFLLDSGAGVSVVD